MEEDDLPFCNYSILLLNIDHRSVITPITSKNMNYNYVLSLQERVKLS